MGASQQMLTDDNLKNKNQFYASDVKLFVIWLEQIQDLDIIPLSKSTQ